MDPIDKLTAGFKVFRDGRFQEQRATYEALVDRGQSPKVALVACSDSRVDPAMVLQADPGDLFIVRNVANLVPPYERGGHYHGTSTAVEFAVDHLEVGHIIVLGHAHCGGIRSLFESPGEAGEGDSFVPTWMGLVRSAYLRVEGTMPDAPLEEKARFCEQSAVMVSLENLMTFANVRER
ncbi:MAG: carbonic anhydrase, partial [Kiloniellales bacterium]|nr:carbonic anhydrase [Kiloniellales bacterium]